MGSVITLPDDVLLDRVRALAPDAEILIWDMSGPAPREAVDVVVVPYMSKPGLLRVLEGTRARLVQSQSIGYDGVAEALPPGFVFANAAGVHEAGTAELAVGLMLASQRGIPGFVRAQDEGRWAHERFESLADRRVLIVGYGGVGAAIEARLEPFETEVVRVGTRARTSSRGPVHAVAELPALLPEADIVVLTVPLSEATRHLADAAFLAGMPDGALLVNVARGPVVDTAALLAELQSGRLRAALDVTDPEPLPAGHPLWLAPGLIVSPHVGGDSTAMTPRMARLVGQQIERLDQGEEPLNVVLRS